MKGLRSQLYRSDQHSLEILLMRHVQDLPRDGHHAVHCVPSQITVGAPRVLPPHGRPWLLSVRENRRQHSDVRILSGRFRSASF
ncbi:hypothetical protein Y032_0044g1013 [Ancylostoma ceylanicum]|uniref:Uncharacterized protein n=1 Tax=Ancylostoma ceylanicum TaxID=53326 RepID=A0A016UE24_9BILA|nr:hypothetical protein Y032_0044g1013 [Ancylostoma ceylanicum]